MVFVQFSFQFSFYFTKTNISDNKSETMVGRPKRAQLETMATLKRIHINRKNSLLYLKVYKAKAYIKDDYKQCRQDMMAMCKTRLDETCAKHGVGIDDGMYNLCKQ